MQRIRDGYKETEIGCIPQHWRIGKIEDICSVRKSKFDPTNNNAENYVALEHIESGTGRLISSASSVGTTSIKSIFKKNDVLFGKLRPYLRKYWFANINGVCATEILPLMANDRCEPKYLFYVVQQDSFINYTVQGSFGTKMPRTSWDEIKAFVLPFPPLHEQQKIADILSAVDQQIEQTDALIEKTKELKKGLMQRLLTKGIGHNEFRDTEIGQIPKGWEVKQLGEVSDINPESLSSKTNPNFVLKYIDIESVTTGKINGTKEFCFAEAPSRARRIVVYNDVIISTVRPYLKSFAIVKTDMDNMICSTGFAVIRAINNNNPDFLFQHTLSDCFINQMSNKMVGSNYPAVNASDVKESLIAVPPINEQKRIAQVLSEFDIQINELEDKKEKLRILKSGLMNNLLAGRVRVKI